VLAALECCKRAINIQQTRKQWCCYVIAAQVLVLVAYFYGWRAVVLGNVRETWDGNVMVGELIRTDRSVSFPFRHGGPIN
jgi:hypothetical protein